MSICMNLDAQRVIFNLCAISALQTGEKLICNSETGEIKIDDRTYFVELRRGYYGAHDNDLINQTFEAAMQSIKKNGEAQSISAHAVNNKVTCATLGTLFDKALDGLSILSQTYVDEGKKPRVHTVEYKFRNEMLQMRSSSNQIAHSFKKTEDEDEYGLFKSDEETDEDNELTFVLGSGFGLNKASKENQEEQSLGLEETCDLTNDDSIQGGLDKVDNRSQDVCDAIFNRVASVARWFAGEGAADE